MYVLSFFWLNAERKVKPFPLWQEANVFLKSQNGSEEIIAAKGIFES